MLVPTMKSLGRNILRTSLLTIVVAVISVPPYLYYSGLQGLPDDRTPLTDVPIPKTVTNAYWRYAGGSGVPKISSKNPYGLIFSILIKSAGPADVRLSGAEHTLLSEAARSMVSREKRYADWHLSNASALIWISRHWTVEETVSTVLLDSYYGHGFHGIDSAARGYFDTALSDISEDQIVYLLVTRAAPSRYDPWCNPDNHRKRFEYFSRRMSLSTEYDSINNQLAPTGSCD